MPDVPIYRNEYPMATDTASAYLTEIVRDALGDLSNVANVKRDAEMPTLFVADLYVTSEDMFYMVAAFKCDAEGLPATVTANVSAPWASPRIPLKLDAVTAVAVWNALNDAATDGATADHLQGAI